MRNLAMLLVLLVFACDTGEFVPDFDQESVDGLKPVYVDRSQLQIGLEGPRDITRAGKIYSYGTLLLVNEIGQGIHVYDNTDPRNPVNLYFVNIPGNNDMAIKSGILYADNFTDLVALQVSLDTVVVTKRLEGMINFQAEFPQQSGVYFECADPDKGIVVGWENATLNNPQCYRP